VNGDRMAPSGSGSTDWADYARKDTYGDMVIKTMERELREECSLSTKIKMQTHARLLERGGKPDFFGVTRVDCDHSKFKVSKKEIKQMGGYRIIRIPFEKTSGIRIILEKKMKGMKPEEVSIQLKIFVEVLKEYERVGVDVFEEK
jgi:hypothetical protein